MHDVHVLLALGHLEVERDAVPAPSKVLTGTSAVADALRALRLAVAAGGATSAAAPVQSSATALASSLWRPCGLSSSTLRAHRVQRPCARYLNSTQSCYLAAIEISGKPRGRPLGAANASRAAPS